MYGGPIKTSVAGEVCVEGKWGRVEEVRKVLGRLWKR